MKAIRIHSFGGPEALTFEEIPEPALNPGEVLVRTRAAGVNPIDWKTCSGGGASPFIGDLPFVPGWEFSGIVEASGSEVTGFNSGDAVCGFVRFPYRAGCFAEYIAVPANEICHVPASVDLIYAAGLPLAGLTAWQALFNKGQLKAQQTVLILAAAGGVGHIAVQLARWKGARVLGTASTANHAFVSGLGCDQVFDYHSTDLAQQVQGVDLIIDGVGGDTAVAALPCLKPSGVMVTLPTITKDQVIAAGAALGVQVEPIRAEPNAAQLAQMVNLVDSGELRLAVANQRPLAEAAEAFRDSATGHVRGKLVLTV